MATAHVTHCNVATPRAMIVGDEVVQSAIDKRPVDGPVEVDETGFVTDQSANPNHGGVEAALYAYQSEDYDGWSHELGRDLRPGLFGENLTTRGIDVNQALIGERWQIGPVTVEVTGPRTPCAKFAAQLGEPGWPKRFNAKDRPGAYLRVLKPGAIAPGDEIAVIERPDHDVTISDVNRIYRRDRDEAGRLRDLPGLKSSFATWAATQAP